MQILFKSRHPEAALMRDTVERRVRFALRRLNALVPRADVQLADVNGPRGGLDKRCQIALRTDGAGEVVVSSVACAEGVAPRHRGAQRPPPAAGPARVSAAALAYRQCQRHHSSRCY